MHEVEVFKFYNFENKTQKKTMLWSEFLKLKNTKEYTYRAYQIGFNQTIINN